MTGITIVRDTLARHRDKPAIGLSLTFPINWQMDDQLAKALTKDLGLHGSWEIFRATPSLGDQIPARSGLYMFVFRSHLVLDVCSHGQHQQTCILYVGRAGDQSSARTLKERYKGEYAKLVSKDPERLWDDEVPSGRAEMLGKYLRIWPIEYWYLVIEDRNKIASLEDRLIKLFAPPLNTYGRLTIKSPPKPAFKVPG